jgi:hypothetical protein
MAKTPERFETIAEMEAEARPGREGEPHGDDSLMGRFDRWDLRRFSAWDAVKAVTLTTFLLLIFAGGSVRKAADELKPGLGRDIVKAVGGPAGWISDRLPFADTRRDLTSWLSPDQQLSGQGFAAGGANQGRTSRLPAGGVPTTPQPLERLLVTGDSLSTPLDIEIASSPTRAPPSRSPATPTSPPGSPTLAWSIGGSSPRARLRRTIPTSSSSLSAPTRAIRCPGLMGSR